jgi:ribonuclease D
MIITSQKQLDDICAQLSTKPYLAIDTEFLRDKTYYSRLCLIQLAGPGVDAVAIDPIDHELDFTAFNALMQNENVVKVFHAARQDLEIFYQMTDDIPTPLFDTQVAAMVCGYGDSIAYYKLVESITGTTLSKNAQFTDWARRPLTDKQLRYALDDVVYLCEVYEKLAEQLEEQGRNDWVLQEMDILRDPNTYDIPLDIVWKRIKIRSDKPEVLAILRELAWWREEQARERDLPRNRVIKDEALADIAMYMPKDKEGLSRIRNVPKDMTKGNKAQHLLDIVEHARASNKKTWPKLKRGTPFKRENQAILEMLKLLLKVNCAEANVAPKLVANVKDLEEIASSKEPKCLAMKGWRYDVFGKDAQALKAGKIMLGIKDEKINRFDV